VRAMVNMIRRISIVVVVPALVIGCNMLPGAVTDLKTGDCFDMPASEGDVSGVQHRPCNEPHDAEVIHVLTHPAGSAEPYPVISGFDDYVVENCSPAFETYTGRDWDTDEELDLGYFHPTLSGRREGDRGFSCHVMLLDGQKLTASVRAGQ
jgi:hypothetical protein